MAVWVHEWLNKRKYIFWYNNLSLSSAYISFWIIDTHLLLTPLVLLEVQSQNFTRVNMYIIEFVTIGVIRSLRRNNPCLCLQLKYRLPSTSPLLRPSGASKITPNHCPGANLVAPMNAMVPGFPAASTLTMSGWTKGNTYFDIVYMVKKWIDINVNRSITASEYYHYLEHFTWHEASLWHNLLPHCGPFELFNWFVYTRYCTEDGSSGASSHHLLLYLK